MACIYAQPPDAPDELSADLWMSTDRGMEGDGFYSTAEWVARIGSTSGTQSTFNEMPVLVEGYWGDGASALEFSTWRNTEYVTTHSAASGSHTFAAVIELQPGAQHEYFFSDTGIIVGIRDRRWGYWDGSWHTVGDQLTDETKGPFRVVWVLDATSPEIRVNGTSYTAGLTYTPVGYSALRLGPPSGQSLEPNAAVRDLVVWSSALSSGDIDTLEEWMEGRSTPAARLPSGGSYSQVVYGQSNSVFLGCWFPGSRIQCVNRGVGGRSITSLSEGGDTAADGASLWDQFIAAIQRMPTGQPVWVVWSQGEEDAETEEAADDYAENFRDLIDETAAACTDHTISWMVEHLNSNCTKPYTATVRAAQGTVAGERSNVYLQDNSDLPLPDGVHYDTADRGTRQDRFDTAIAAV
jgi:hypothetical protein